MAKWRGEKQQRTIVPRKNISFSLNGEYYPLLKELAQQSPYNGNVSWFLNDLVKSVINNKSLYNEIFKQK